MCTDMGAHQKKKIRNAGMDSVFVAISCSSFSHGTATKRAETENTTKQAVSTS